MLNLFSNDMKKLIINHDQISIRSLPSWHQMSEMHGEAGQRNINRVHLKFFFLFVFYPQMLSFTREKVNTSLKFVKTKGKHVCINALDGSKEVDGVKKKVKLII